MLNGCRIEDTSADGRRLAGARMDAESRSRKIGEARRSSVSTFLSGDGSVLERTWAQAQAYGRAKSENAEKRGKEVHK